MRSKRTPLPEPSVDTIRRRLARLLAIGAVRAARQRKVLSAEVVAVISPAE